MAGKLFGVGVGPGAPGLLTLKAADILDKADVIACPAKGNAPGQAYSIAVQACPQIAQKEILLLHFPMKAGDQSEAHTKAADNIISLLKNGRNTAFLTLGDPCVYSTFSYVSAIVSRAGYETEVVNGVTSFCAAAARTGIPVALGDEAFAVTAGEYIDIDGTLVIMKAGSRLKELKEKIISSGKNAFLVENCGMTDERVYTDIASIPDEAGYLSVLIVKGR